MDNWLDYVIDDDRDYVQSAWRSLRENFEPKRLVMVSVDKGICGGLS